jgi:hypothetical protein
MKVNARSRELHGQVWHNDNGATNVGIVAMLVESE